MIAHKDPNTELQILGAIFIIALVGATYAISVSENFGWAIAPSPDASWCSDSDASNIYSKGTVTYHIGSGGDLITASVISNDPSVTDKCQDATTVIEYTCVGTAMTPLYQSCALGCVDGACNPLPLDTTKPIVTLNYPIGTSFNTNQQVSFSCTGTDDTALKSVEFWLTEPSKPFYNAESRLVSGINTTQTFSRTFSVAGSYAWNCKYVDLAGNNAWGYIDGRSAGFTVQQGSFCGNNIIDAGEQCDGSASINTKCTDLGFGCGNITCNSDCTLSTSRCAPVDSCGGASCGDGILGIGEQCEPGLASTVSCIDLGFAGGNILCANSCQFDTSQCTNIMNYSCSQLYSMQPNYFTNCAGQYDAVCFNKYSAEYKGCTNYNPDYCTTQNSEAANNILCNAKIPTCGNSIVEAGEQCDLSNLAGATCTSVNSSFTGGTLKCYTPLSILGCKYDKSQCVISKPDLVVYNVTFRNWSNNAVLPYSNLPQYTKVRTEITIRNNGTAFSIANSPIIYNSFWEDISASNGSAPFMTCGLKGNVSAGQIFTCYGPSFYTRGTGRYIFNVTTDYTNVVPESNERNNMFIVWASVNSIIVPRPDMIVTNISLVNVNTKQVYPQNAVPAGVFVYPDATIKNNGATYYNTADGYTNRFDIKLPGNSSVIYKQCYVAPGGMILSGSISKCVGAPFTTPGAPYALNVTVTTDWTNMINEEKEYNNGLSTFFTII